MTEEVLLCAFRSCGRVYVIVCLCVYVDNISLYRKLIFRAFGRSCLEGLWFVNILEAKVFFHGELHIGLCRL